MIRRRPARRAGRGNTIVAILALGTIAALLLVTVATVLPRDSSNAEDSTLGDASVRITPGAEVARLETKVANDPADIASIVVLAEVLANRGGISESIPWFEQAVAARPGDADLRLAFGRTLTRFGGWYDAELQLRAGHEIAPHDPTIAFFLGDLYETPPQPDVEEAARWYQSAIEAAPDSVVATQARERLVAIDSSVASSSASPAS